MNLFWELQEAEVNLYENFAPGSLLMAFSTMEALRITELDHSDTVCKSQSLDLSDLLQVCHWQ